jgi:hypothetical protein
MKKQTKKLNLKAVTVKDLAVTTGGGASTTVSLKYGACSVETAKPTCPSLGACTGAGTVCAA